jgi:hypothetical protein
VRDYHTYLIIIW